jgi:hypothetical protein
MGLLTLKPYKILVQNTINYLDAGPDQYAVCSTSITLTATVLGNLVGHTLLWEQISGNTLGVTISGPTNTLSLSYTNAVPPGSFSDKTWRLWIDKGSVHQMYSDVVVFGTPTDQIYESYNSNATGNHAINLGTSSNCRNITLSYGRSFPLTSALVGTGFAACGNSAYPFLQWTQPCQLTSLRDYTLQSRITYSTWANVATIASSAIMYTGALTYGTVYRLLANFNEGNNTIGSYPSNILALDVNYLDNPSGYYHTIEGVDQIQLIDFAKSTNTTALHSVSNYLVSLQFLKIFAAPADFTADITYASYSSNNTAIHTLSGYNVALQTLKIFAAPTDFTADITYADYSSNNIKGHTITGYTVTNTGGGSVGGP